jgi:hypothetical protein
VNLPVDLVLTVEDAVPIRRGDLHRRKTLGKFDSPAKIEPLADLLEEDRIRVNVGGLDCDRTQTIFRCRDVGCKHTSGVTQCCLP